ncbi:MAG TPA: NAD(P)/FAD-dependent oxidoreductase [Bryobacteraceae bacterium]|jgi:pyruvate/2-oxoglutarate dehydrogenase complex dihydrolipoamide dehydrogenase (E3) component|nr:NAD(P)/FAD-dependent oxidoreductase [Bryobacteraceae bacterium]
MSYQYDMIVIGGGAAGLTAAGMSALLGAKTALIERQRLGGECTWTGCIPSKTLLRTAKAVHQIKTAERFGLTATEAQFEFLKIMDHVRATRRHVYENTDAPPEIEKLGVEVIAGSARFLNSHAIEIFVESSGISRRLSSRFFIIATGSRPRTPGFSENTLTNETIFELKAQPRRLLVMGAGPVGVEMAQAFTRLGSEVRIITPGKRILPRDDAEHAGHLQEQLASEGVAFIFERKVASFDEGAATLDSGEVLMCDTLLAAMGREPRVEDLQLQDAGVQCGESGIEIDRRCRTSQRNIYAVGDVTGKYQFTHMAEHMSKVAVTNTILRWPQALDEKHLVWATFTDPELAHLGESELELRERGKQFGVYRFAFSELDRAITDNETRGEVKVFADRRGRILGASILGAKAGEMISEYALAMRHGLRLTQIANTIHPYPTYLLANRKAADRFVARQLDSPLLELLGRILRYRGQRRGSRVL